MSKEKESIVIVGLGGMGFHLAKWLAHEGYSITAIEANADQVARADRELDARLLQADAMTFDCWKQVASERIDYLMAVTDNDAVNITACLIGGRCGARRKIARVQNLELWAPDALLTPKDLGIDLVIRPSELCAQEIARLLKMRSGALVVDGDADMVVVSVRVTSESVLADKTLSAIAGELGGFDYRIVAIARGIETIIPGGDHEVKLDDHVFILAHREDQPELLQALHVPQQRKHTVMVLGGGLIGQRVAALLEDRMPIRLLELDEARAERLAHRLKKTEVLHGDARDPDTLIRAGLFDMDTVIAATKDNETNIMASVTARHLRRSRGHDAEGLKTITLVRKEEYLALGSALGADMVLNPKILAGNSILKFMRRDKLLAVTHLHGCEAEVVELIPDPGSPITRTPLNKLGDQMQNRMIIGGFRRGTTWQVALGQTQIEAGDQVIGICVSRDLPALERLFDK